MNTKHILKGHADVPFLTFKYQELIKKINLLAHCWYGENHKHTHEAFFSVG